MKTDTDFRQNIIIISLIAVLAACVYNAVQINNLEERAELKVKGAREFAGKLAAQKLYLEAAAHIEKYLGDNLVAPAEVESTLIYLADLYFEHIGNYEKAMAFYLKALFMFPATKYKNDIERRVIECKDRLGRRLEAANDLDAINAAEKAVQQNKTAAAPSTVENSVVVARIGETSITMADYLSELDSLFAESQVDISKPENRARLLKEVIVRKVLGKIARSKRLDSDSQISRQLNLVREKLMIDKLLNEEVFSKTEVDEMSMKLYYDAHKNEMRTPDKYKFEFIGLADKTEAVAISSGGDANKFSSYASRQTQFAPLDEISAAVEADLSAITGEISASRPGEIVKAPAVKPDGTFVVLKLSNFIKGDILPYESVKQAVKNALTAQKRENDLQNYIMKNFAELNVVVYDDVFKRESGAGK